jgi:MFS family permease
VNASIWAPLRLADFRKLWVGQLVSVIGDKLHQIAMGVMVFVITGSALQMGLMLAMTALPALLFGLAAGAFVDRWDKRRTMIVADLARATLVLGVPFAVQTSVYLAYVLAFTVATIGLFFQPAKQALIAELVGEDELLPANSLDQASTSAAELLGLGLAGTLVALLGYQRAFWLDSATFLFSAGAIALIRYRPARKAAGVAETHTKLTTEVLDGMRFIADNPTLRGLLAMWTTAALGFGAALTITYLLALDRYHAGARGLAILDIGITVGLLIGSLTVALPRRINDGWKIISAMVVFGIVLAGLALADRIVFALPLLAVTGVANMWFLVPSITLVQRLTPDSMRGRVLAARGTLAAVLSVAGMLLGGVLIERIGIVLSICVAAMPVLLGALVGVLNSAVREA